MNGIMRDMESKAKAFWHRNAGVVSAVVSVFIVVEGVVLLFSPSKWWAPLLLLLALSAVVLSWRDHKVIIKAAVTVAILAVAASLSMVAAVAYSGSAEKAIMVPLAFVLGLSAFLLVTYIGLDTGASRWTAAQISLILAFVLTYMSVPGGLTVMAVVAAVTVIAGGSLWMLLAPMWATRSAGMPERPTMLEDRTTRKLERALGEGWTMTVRDDLKRPLHVAMKEGDGRLYVFIPMYFASEVRERRKTGITYRHRGMGRYLYAVLAKTRAQTAEDAVTIIEDINGASDYFGKTIPVPIPDSETGHEYTSILDMSGSVADIRGDIDRIMHTFDYKDVPEKAARKAMGLVADGRGKEESADNGRDRQAG